MIQLKKALTSKRMVTVVWTIGFMVVWEIGATIIAQDKTFS